MPRITSKRCKILSKGHKQAAAFAKQAGLHPMNWAYVASVEDLGKARGVPVVVVKGWLDRPDSAALIEEADKLGIVFSDNVRTSSSDARQL